MKKELQIILPVFNEEKSITRVVKEIYSTIYHKVPFEFIICEDGSKDKTKEILKSLSNKYPMKLLLSDRRKGYSEAIINGFRTTTAKFVLILDSDGQCDPRDFPKFWQKRQLADIIIGWRIQRNDHFQRKLLSYIYKQLHKLLFHTKIHDPSCPFVLIKQASLLKLLKYLGILKQGFWWEFIARSIQLKYRIYEIPVNHRPRLDGKTRVYTLLSIPSIGIMHVFGIIKIYFNNKILYQQ